MNKFTFVLSSFFVTAAFAEAPGGPMDWSSVHTNEIARWKASPGAVNGLVVDKDKKSVKMLLEATGLAKDAEAEFFLIGPRSDRAYESLFVSVATPSAIADAFKTIGLPKGFSPEPKKSVVWPEGERVTMSFRQVGKSETLALADLLNDSRAEEEGKILAEPVLATGGVRDGKGEPKAETEAPCAVFALYDSAQSLLQLDGVFDQSATYGRFKSAKEFKAGDLVEMTITWDGAVTILNKTVSITSATDLEKTVLSLRDDARGKRLYAKLSFSDDITIARASEFARAFGFLDGKVLRMNGCADGQFFYRAFLPEEGWKNRAGRIFQPFELHVNGKGERTFTYVEEDFGGEGDEPILKPHETKISNWSEIPSLIAKCGDEAAKISVMFIYAPSSTTLGQLKGILPAVGRRIDTYYFFAE